MRGPWELSFHSSLPPMQQGFALTAPSPSAGRPGTPANWKSRDTERSLHERGNGASSVLAHSVRTTAGRPFLLAPGSGLFRSWPSAGPSMRLGHCDAGRRAALSSQRWPACPRRRPLSAPRPAPEWPAEASSVASPESHHDEVKHARRWSRVPHAVLVPSTGWKPTQLPSHIAKTTTTREQLTSHIGSAVLPRCSGAAPTAPPGSDGTASVQSRAALPDRACPS